MKQLYFESFIDDRIRIIEETLTDGSQVYNVEVGTGPVPAITFRAMDADDAMKIAEFLRDKAFDCINS